MILIIWKMKQKLCKVKEVHIIFTTIGEFDEVIQGYQTTIGQIRPLNNIQVALNSNKNIYQDKCYMNIHKLWYFFCQKFLKSLSNACKSLKPKLRTILQYHQQHHIQTRQQTQNQEYKTNDEKSMRYQTICNKCMQEDHKCNTNMKKVR